MQCNYACHSPEHQFSRRRFLHGLTAGAAGLAGFSGLLQPAAARELQSAHKRVLLIFLSGGVSQLETLDPKPGTDTGGPFLTIPFMLSAMGGPHILYAWLAGADLALCDGLVYAQLGAALVGGLHQVGAPVAGVAGDGEVAEGVEGLDLAGDGRRKGLV